MLRDEKITFRSRLGFIGLGHLGSRIALRLVTAGFPVVVYDLDPRRSPSLPQSGPRSHSILENSLAMSMSCCRAIRTNAPCKLLTWDPATF
jgi:phosphoglycerate dehydrogenase-like enzyme